MSTEEKVNQQRESKGFGKLTGDRSRKKERTAESSF